MSTKITEVIQLLPHESIALRMVLRAKYQGAIKLMWMGILAQRQRNPIHIFNAEHLEKDKYIIEFQCEQLL